MNVKNTGNTSIKPSEELTNPKRYTQGIECWDYIISHNMNFIEGNIIKYITRYRNKNGIEDLLKAKVYLDKLIQVVAKEVQEENQE